MPICFRLLTHWIRLAASRAACTAGRRSAMSTLIIAMTTSSSINVKARRGPVRRAKNDVPFRGLETSAKRVGTKLARRVPGGVPRCFGPKHHLGLPEKMKIHSENARPAQGVVRIDAGRSSDFRAEVSSLLIVRTDSRSDQQWHKRGNTRKRTVTAAGPFRIRTGFPVRRPRQAAEPGHQHLLLTWLDLSGCT
jgi:hypothetical protein